MGSNHMPDVGENIPIRIYDTTKQWVLATESYLGKVKDRYQEIYPASIVTRSGPRTIGHEYHWKFRQQLYAKLAPAFVALIPNGRIWGPEGTVITHDKSLLADVAPAFCRSSKEHPIFSEQNLPSPLEFDCTAVVLTAPGGQRNFFHWLFDVLPRIHLLYSSRFALEQIDRHIVNNIHLAYQRETLQKLGIVLDDVIESDCFPHIRCRRLIVPSITRLDINMPAWIPQYIRSIFMHDILRVNHRQRKFIYISRQGAKRRRIVNEFEVRSFLENHGFTTILPETLSVAQQASIFASARCVIGPHGAGLSDIVFCPPHTKIVEFFSPSCVRPHYWGLSNLLELDYHYLLGEGKRPPEYIDPDKENEDITVDIRALKNLLKLASIIY
jgi:hypothetical protein